MRSLTGAVTVPKVAGFSVTLLTSGMRGMCEGKLSSPGITEGEGEGEGEGKGEGEEEEEGEGEGKGEEEEGEGEGEGEGEAEEEGD